MAELGSNLGFCIEQEPAAVPLELAGVIDPRGRFSHGNSKQFTESKRARQDDPPQTGDRNDAKRFQPNQPKDLLLPPPP